MPWSLGPTWAEQTCEQKTGVKQRSRTGPKDTAAPAVPPQKYCGQTLGSQSPARLCVNEEPWEDWMDQ